MPDLTAKFSVIDQMSDQIDGIAQVGLSMVEQFERAGDTASAALDGISSGTVTAVSAVDGVAVSIGEAVEKADYWTESISNYDEASVEAAESMSELSAAQEEAAAAMAQYDDIISSGTTDLDTLEAAAERAGNAAENLAEANDKASNATEKFSKAAENASEEAENGGKKGVVAVEAIASALAAAGITATVKDIAASVYELADAYSEAEKIVVNATGATGETLDALGESMLAAYAGNDDALADAAGAIGEINTRMGLTGDALTDVTGKFLDFADITGTTVVGSVQNVTKIMNKWGIEGSELESVLDKLAYAGQISGASVNTLSSTLITGAASFQEMGLSLDNAISMLAQFELYGMSGTTAITAMRTAVRNFADDGQNAETALQSVISEIANMESAADATALAVDTFGSRAGVDMANAIRSGAITVDTLTGSLDVARGTLARTAEAGESLGEKWQKASNNIGTAFTTAVQPAIDGISSGLADMANDFGNFLNEHQGVTKVLTALGVGLGVVVVGIAAVAAASLTAIPAVAALGTAIGAAIWPITAIAAGIALVSGLVMALVKDYDDLNGKTAGMTAATREQYYEVQDLNEEYERACEQYGETSEEALRLKYQVDDLSTAFEANRQTVEEFTAEVDALCQSATQITDDFGSTLAEINANEVGTLSLIQKYEDLATQADLTAAQEKQLEAVTQKLYDTYPDLAAQLDSATMSAEDYVEAMRQACEQEAEELRQQQAQETYVEALAKRAELEEEIAKAEENIRLEQERMSSMSERAHFWTGGEWDDLNAYKDALEQLQAAEAENDATIASIEQGWEDIAEAEAEAAEECITAEQAVAEVYDGVREKVEELCNAYDAAYQAAIESFEGQFGLFDEARADMNASVENAQAALDSQLAYWESYGSNLEVLKTTSAEDLGITQENYDALMALAQDGSEEAAGLAASMSDAINSGNADAVAELANTVGEVSAKQQEIADMTADWQTDFTEQMDAIEQEMQNTIDGMNLTDEAEKAASETISSYADAIRAGKGNAISAAQEVANAVTSALKTGNANPRVTVSNTGSVAGHARGTTNAENIFLAGEEGPELVARPAATYATGTTNSDDFFIAGENGPELIVGEQGSTVFPTGETDRLIEAINERRQPLQILANSNETNTGSDRQMVSEQEKRILLEIAGSGAIEIGGNGADKEAILEILYEHLKPVLMSIIQSEIYEEGELSYDY